MSRRPCSLPPFDDHLADLDYPELLDLRIALYDRSIEHEASCAEASRCPVSDYLDALGVEVENRLVGINRQWISAMNSAAGVSL